MPVELPRILVLEAEYEAGDRHGARPDERVAFDRISWAAAGLIAIGSLIGGWLGSRYGRRLSPGVLRILIVVVGLIGLYRLVMV